MRFHVKIWHWYRSLTGELSQYYHAGDGSITNFSMSILEIDFLKIKIGWLLRYLTLCTNVGLLKWCSRSFKIDINSEL